MAELKLGNNSCGSVFSLNGRSEDSGTYAVGWGLLKSPILLKSFLKKLGVHRLTITELDSVVINLQKHGPDNGFTDIEISIPGKLHIILEAKRYWELPSDEQLKKYCSRFENTETTKLQQLLVTVSTVSTDFAYRAQGKMFQSINLKHLSWSNLFDISKSAIKLTSSLHEKFWLSELIEHLKEYRSMTDIVDNSAYCVVLSESPMNDKDPTYTWVDVVTQDRSYFHPIGIKGWPNTAPNYIAFRKGGKLLSVHHIDKCEVCEDISQLNQRWVKTTIPHFVYSLGPPMYPSKPIKNGKLYANGRYWCAIDTLLSGAYDTISDARDETQRRLM